MTHYAPRPGSITEQLLVLIQQHPEGITALELAATVGISAKNIPGLVQTAINAHIVERADRHINERRTKVYRPCSSSPDDTQATSPTEDSTWSTLIGTLHPASSATTRQPQPAVGQNTGSPEAGVRQPPSADRAEACQPATSIPEAKGRGMGPAAPTVSTAQRAPRRIPKIAIDSEGRLAIDDTVYSATETLAIGDFLACTEKLWRST